MLYHLDGRCIHARSFVCDQDECLHPKARHTIVRAAATSINSSRLATAFGHCDGLVVGASGRPYTVSRPGFAPMTTANMTGASPFLSSASRAEQVMQSREQLVKAKESALGAARSERKAADDSMQVGVSHNWTMCCLALCCLGYRQA